MALLPPERHAPAGTPRPPTPRIVVVGDAPMRTPLLAHALGAAGFGVRRVGSGAEALWSALRARPDLVVLDLELPDGQGLALLGRLRAQSRVPVILLGAPHSPIAVAQALDQGGDDYLTHPVDPTSWRPGCGRSCAVPPAGSPRPYAARAASRSTSRAGA
jgi:CheY-like chemotaxis protein